MFRAIHQKLKSSPILSNCLFCVGAWTLGDIGAQRLEHERTTGKEFTWDQNRTWNFATFGVFINGPVLTKWYPFLDRTAKSLLASSVRGTSKTTSKPNIWAEPVLKVLIETALFDIPFLALFFGYINVAEGGTLQSYRHKVDSELLQCFVTGLAIWPVVQLTNFRFVPILYQPYVVNTVCVAWDGYLSHQNNKTNATETSYSGKHKNKNHHEPKHIVDLDEFSHGKVK